MEQSQQEFGSLINFTIISKALGILDDSFNKEFQPQIVQGNLMLCIKSKELLNKLTFNKRRIIELGQSCGFSSLHLFVLLEHGDAIAAVCNFDPAEGMDEDIATGTTNGSFLAYLKHRGALRSLPIYKIEQGETLKRLPFIYGKFENDRVWIGGKAAESKHLRIDLR